MKPERGGKLEGGGDLGRFGDFRFEPDFMVSFVVDPSCKFEDGILFAKRTDGDASVIVDVKRGEGKEGWRLKLEGSRVIRNSCSRSILIWDLNWILYLSPISRSKKSWTRVMGSS